MNAGLSTGRKLTIDTAPVFVPLLEPARNKAAYGGRGSGKSHNFAELAIEEALRFPGEAGEGLRMAASREVQKSLKESAKFLLESKLVKFGLGEADGFRVYMDRIATPKDGVIVFPGLADHTAESIKSYEGFHRWWTEEAQTVSARSIGLLRPTVRWENKRLGLQSEMWWSWNPRHKRDPVDRMFRGETVPTGSIIVKANYNDNPWFPGVLEQERLDCLANDPDQYAHIWEGDYATIIDGAYYARHLAEAQTQGRIGNVAIDPLMQVRAYWDIGVSDACSIWIAQHVGKEIRILDYYEAVGQPLAAHLNWLRSQGYAAATCVLPHDGARRDMVSADRFEDHIRNAGFAVQTIANQGKGAAMKRVEAARRLFPRMWFNEKTTAGGREALAFYHERMDEKRQMGLGPEHDWSSHAADAFGLMAVAYEEPMAFEETYEMKRGWVV